MKHYLLILTALLVLTACQNRTEEQKQKATENVLSAASEVSTTEIDSACYLLVDGNGKDSLVATLHIKGNDVTGYLVYNYYQKDGRFGKLTGKKKGNEVTADWIFMQEGMTDTVKVAFKINGNSIEQKQNDFDKQTGKEYLPETAPYFRTYNKVDCSVTERLVSQAKRFL